MTDPERVDTDCLRLEMEVSENTREEVTLEDLEDYLLDLFLGHYDHVEINGREIGDSR